MTLVRTEPVYRCWVCASTFTLHGSRPRVTLTGVALVTGAARLVIPAPEAQQELSENIAVSHRRGKWSEPGVPRHRLAWC
jgi:hypothetical protein